VIKGVATLSGDDLIWAMCRARGHAPVWAPTGVAYRSEPGAWVYPRYTSDSEAGELIARYAVSVERPSEQTGWQWRAAMEGVGGVEQGMLGETARGGDLPRDCVVPAGAGDQASGAGGMTAEQFEALATLLRSRGSSREAARMVLVEGYARKAPRRSTGLEGGRR